MLRAGLLLLFSALPVLAGALQLNSAAFNTAQFTVTDFTTGLFAPTAPVQLSDGSIAIGTYSGIMRQTATRNNLYNGQGVRIGLVAAGGYYVDSRFNFFVNPPVNVISILRPGNTAADPLTVAASFQFDFPSGWIHRQPGIAVRPKPGQSGQFDLVFAVGADGNGTASTRSVQMSGLTSATLDGDSLYAMTLDLSTSTPAATNVRKIARGIRNVVGMGFQPGTGDFYFVDNAIDGDGPLGDQPPQADELNRITAADFDNGTVPNFGFPTCYTQYRTGAAVGSGCVSPLYAFQPIPNGTALGSESEGPAMLAFAPAAFPEAFRNGIFVGFSGKGSVTGAANEENAVGFYDFNTGSFLHFAENSQNGVYQPIGLLATSDSLYISDYGSGTVYRVNAAAPEPATWLLLLLAIALSRFRSVPGLCAKARALLTQA